MYCRNCGKELSDNAYVCTNCGVLTSTKKVVERKIKKENNIQGIISIIFSSLAVLISLNLLTKDISIVSTFTKIIDEFAYIISKIGLSSSLIIVSIILSSSNKNHIYNKIGLSLSLLSLFFVITEIFVIILY